MRILSVFGTRPEAIKMAPLVRALRMAPDIESLVCASGQHQEMLNQVLEFFEIRPDHHLSLMAPDQALNGLASRMFGALDAVIQFVQPARVLVHGDTTTAMVAALTAFHRKIPVAHIEAGLRSGDVRQPWPEEANRRVVDIVADCLFAPTLSARDNLLSERLGGTIYVTGNTVIDALRITDRTLRENGHLCADIDDALPAIKSGKKLLLVTGHRRENFGAGFSNICSALRELSAYPDTQIIYPVHLNPNVQKPVREALGACSNIDLIAPVDYVTFVRLMQRAHCILTDSGGIQEEAPYLGKPVLVMRDVTERPEAIASGAVRLVGTDPRRIVASVRALFDEQGVHGCLDRHMYGDGFASERIVAALRGLPTVDFRPASGKVSQILSA